MSFPNTTKDLHPRHFSVFDQMIINSDEFLKILFGVPPMRRPTPAENVEEKPLTTAENNHSAGLMRVNHTGEIAAQALYIGQSWVAKNLKVRESLQLAAEEEQDHLAWCALRLQELGSHPSYLNPVWYGGSFLIGLIAGMAGDQWSLGFVVETERQVEAHLREHLEKLPVADERSRAIVEKMQEDEKSHGEMAQKKGGEALPFPIPLFMRMTSKVMTGIAYWV